MNKLLSYPEVEMVASETGEHYRFEPQKDITAWESAKLVELYAYVVATKKQCDWQSFVNDNGLQRHFIKLENKEE
jgi:hypothetical protein